MLLFAEVRTFRACQVILAVFEFRGTNVGLTQGFLCVVVHALPPIVTVSGLRGRSHFRTLPAANHSPDIFARVFFR